MKFGGHPKKDKEELIKNNPLAFSSSSNLVTATSRLVLETSDNDGTFLNIEIFDHSMAQKDDSSSSSPSSLPILLFIPGVCESAETMSVQKIVHYAKEVGVRVAVVELEGHGLSSGHGRCLCPDFSRLLQQTVEFISFVLSQIGACENEVPYAVCGASMGGALAVYAAEIISRHLNNIPCDDMMGKSLHPSLSFPRTFLGVVPITPALGVRPEALPPKPIVWVLSVAASLLPSAQLSLAPLEDPEHYNCPPETKRNYSGHWPLGTSKMLLDLTAYQIPHDVSRNKLTLAHVDKVLILAGEKDRVIPVESCQAFYDHLQCHYKDLKILKKADHDLLYETKTSQIALEYLFSVFTAK
mmetsp:Transcript_9854/g.14423  ORF Transcript_9854/g.14423 Transcript_9854/m.14423 type:complete len:355 (-) Transcript_9854:464-1528(-)